MSNYLRKIYIKFIFNFEHFTNVWNRPQLLPKISIFLRHLRETEKFIILVFNPCTQNVSKYCIVVWCWTVSEWRACLVDRSAKCCRVKKNREIVCVSVCARVHVEHVHTCVRLCVCMCACVCDVCMHMSCTCARVYVSKVEESDVR